MCVTVGPSVSERRIDVFVPATDGTQDLPRRHVPGAIVVGLQSPTLLYPGHVGVRTVVSPGPRVGGHPTVVTVTKSGAGLDRRREATTVSAGTPCDNKVPGRGGRPAPTPGTT